MEMLAVFIEEGKLAARLLQSAAEIFPLNRVWPSVCFGLDVHGRSAIRRAPQLVFVHSTITLYILPKFIERPKNAVEGDGVRAAPRQL